MVGNSLDLDQTPVVARERTHRV